MTRQSTRRTADSGESDGFSTGERAAMKTRADEIKATSGRGRGANAADGERTVLAKIAEMPEGDRVLAERLHALITASAPSLTPKLWYGQPAYARDGKVVCFFRGAVVDGERYLTLGFSGAAKLDDGAVWPTAFAVTGLAGDDEARIGALVQKAVG